MALLASAGLLVGVHVVAGVHEVIGGNCPVVSVETQQTVYSHHDTPNLCLFWFISATTLGSAQQRRYNDWRHEIVFAHLSSRRDLYELAKTFIVAQQKPSSWPHVEIRSPCWTPESSLLGHHSSAYGTLPFGNPRIC